jgi:hypothetical protein
MTKELYNDLKSDKVVNDDNAGSIDNNVLPNSTTNKSKYAHPGSKSHPNKVK